MDHAKVLMDATLRILGDTTGGRSIVPSSVPADRAEVISDVPTGSLDARTEQLRMERAREQIIDDITFERGWKKKTFADVIKWAYDDGRNDELAAKLKAFRCAFGQGRIDADYELSDCLDKLVKDFIDDEMVAQELAEMESEDIGDELAAKERAA